MEPQVTYDGERFTMQVGEVREGEPVRFSFTYLTDADGRVVQYDRWLKREPIVPQVAP